MTRTFRAKSPLRQRRDHFHPLAVGDVISVIRLPIYDAPFHEGLAVIKAAAPGHHVYVVRFIGDPRFRVRFVHPAYQKNPTQTLAWLRELWRASQSDSSDEFFPAND